MTDKKSKPVVDPFAQDKWEYDANPPSVPVTDDDVWRVLYECGDYVPEPEDEKAYVEWKKRNGIAK